MSKSSSSLKPNEAVRVLRLRIKDKHAGALNDMAYWVNQVWNYCNELSYRVWQRERRFLSGYDFAPYTKGAAKEGVALHSQTIQAVSEEYAIRRKQFRKVRLNWRVSSGARRSLGWIPFKASALRYRNGQVWFFGIDQPLSLWDSYGLGQYDLGPGSICQDARGRWYLNVSVKVVKEGAGARAAMGDVGIDLGLKDFATCSDGLVIESRRIYRGAEQALAKAQRANKKRQVKRINAQISNRRKEFHHQLSRRLVNDHAAIFVGDVNAAALAKTNMAKSVLDAGWSAFRTMLRYKCDSAGVWFEEVDEAFSTQDCSACGARSGPKGLQELGSMFTEHAKAWSCTCGAHHDRDVNAARNILRRGRATLAVGIPVV